MAVVSRRECPRSAATARREADTVSVSVLAATERLVHHMGKDKKVRDGKITLILPRRIGDAFEMRDASAAELREFLAEAA